MPSTSIEVLRCIGCGAVSTPQRCLGTCVDRRLDLVTAGDHAAAETALQVLADLLDERATLLAEIARSPLTPAHWEALRPRARAALRTPPPVMPAAALTTWACDTCGRIEAPQPCLGVCVRPPVAMVPATEHHALLDHARDRTAALERLAVPLRLLAWTTPRPGAWAASASAIEQMIEADLAGIHR